MSTIKKIEETIYKNVFKYNNYDLEALYYDQYATYYALIDIVSTIKQAEKRANQIQKYLDKTNLSMFFEVDAGTMNSDYENAPAVRLTFKNSIYKNQISEIIRICCDILNIKCQDKVLQGSIIMHTHKDFNNKNHIIENDLAFVEDYNEKEDICKIEYFNGGAVTNINANNLKFYNKKRKFNLPEGICWDTRNTVLNNQTWFNAVLIKNGKNTSTKTKTILKAMYAIAKNREEEGLWTHDDVIKYLSQYKKELETGWTPELAKYLAKSGPRESKNKVENVKNNTEIEVNNTTSVSAKSNRMYNLPKYICYDKAESRNRERNVFQTQLNVNGKILKNNLYTVKDAVVDVVSKMLKHTDVWSLETIGDYLKTYDPEMENGNFVPSNTPKSPSYRKREKKKHFIRYIDL